MTPDNALQHIARLLTDTQPGPVAAWFADGVADFLDGRADLETALSLKGPGPRGNRQARRKLETRDRLIHQAVSMMTGTPWQRCVALADRIKRLDRVAKPTEFDKLLLSARQHGRVPTSPEGLWNLLSRSSESSTVF